MAHQSPYISIYRNFPYWNQAGDCTVFLQSFLSPLCLSVISSLACTPLWRV